MLLGIGLIDADILVGERTEGSEQCCFVRVSHCHTVDIGSSIIEGASISIKSNAGTHNIFYYLSLTRYILLPP